MERGESRQESGGAALESNDIEYCDLRITELPLKQMHQRVFHENGDVTLRQHIDLGPGYRFRKADVDNWLCGKDGKPLGREAFVALLKRIYNEVKVHDQGVSQTSSHLTWPPAVRAGITSRPKNSASVNKMLMFGALPEWRHGQVHSLRSKARKAGT